MAAEDYISDFFDDYENEVECKFCGIGPLQWEECRGAHNRKKWVLIDEDGNIHDCRGAATSDEFPSEV